MNIERIKERVSNGFRPFTLCLSDGRKIAVPFPDAIALGRHVVVVVGKNDRVNTIDPLHVVSLEEKHRVP